MSAKTVGLLLANISSLSFVSARKKSAKTKVQRELYVSYANVTRKPFVTYILTVFIVFVFSAVSFSILPLSSLKH